MAAVPLRQLPQRPAAAPAPAAGAAQQGQQAAQQAQGAQRPQPGGLIAPQPQQGAVIQPGTGQQPPVPAPLPAPPQAAAPWAQQPQNTPAIPTALQQPPPPPPTQQVAAPQILALTPEFQGCYLAHGEFPGPSAIVSHTTYGDSALRVHRERLVARQRQSALFVVDGRRGRRVKVPVRDILADGRVSKQNLFEEQELKDWLGDASPANNPAADLATKVDPKCRFVHLVNDSMTSPLEISFSLFTRICTYHQVTPSLLDFLYVYGTPHSKDREIRFSGFRTERVLVNPNPGNVLTALERSGRRYQMCYNIKSAALKLEDTGEKAVITKIWTVRQAAIHHQLDVGTGCQFWMFGDPHAALKARIAEGFSERENHRQKFDTLEHALETSLNVHLINCRWGMEGWPELVRSLEEIIEKLTQYLFSIGQEDAKIRLEPGAMGTVQEYEDKTNETIMVLESNVDVMRAMVKFYNSLVIDEAFPAAQKKACRRVAQAFAAQVDELIYDSRTQIARARILAKLVADRKTILIQHLQAQAAARAEDFTATMWKAAERSENEAIAMRIITVITAFYLPPTVASTFFSTDVVKYQGGGGGGEMGESTSWLALWRWLELSLPLWLFTALVVGFWGYWERRKRVKRYQELREKHPDVFGRIDGGK